MANTAISASAGAMFIFANLFVTLGSFAADFNETHVYNPKWPPHARFHNGQTMNLSLLLSSLSLFMVFRPAASAVQRRDSIWLATMVGSLYCLAGLGAILYPGTAWADPEFEVSIKAPQLYIFGIQLIVIWLAYRSAASTLAKVKSG